MNNKAIIAGSVIIGILLLALACVYWVTPAGSLPSYLPGFEAGSSAVHFKHGLGAAILGVALFVFAWFRTGPRTR